MNCWALIAAVLLAISNWETAESACNKVNEEVTCTGISDLRNETLSELENIDSVTEIRVEGNGELFVHYKAFAQTPHLKIIDFQDNKIQKIYPETFKDLPVTHFYLGSNDIEVIYAGSFSNLTALQVIRLPNNKLRTVAKGVFSDLPATQLVLSKNSITDIENMALENMPNLKKLQLDHNDLNTIFVHTLLTYPERLEILWLHNNSLTTVSNYMLQKLTNLTLLNLGFNSIFIIEPNSFEQTPKLEILILTNNRLKQVDGSIFPRKGMNYLQKLYLDNNRLMFLSSSFFFRLNALKRVTLVGNPWICPCLDIIWRILAENNIVERCAEDYTNGERPICVSEDVAEKTCRYQHSEELREKYEGYKKRYPLYKTPLSCIL